MKRTVKTRGITRGVDMSSRTVRAARCAAVFCPYTFSVAENLDSSFGRATTPDNNPGTQQQEHAATALRIGPEPCISGFVLISH